MIRSSGWDSDKMLAVKWKLYTFTLFWVVEVVERTKSLKNTLVME
jgi:hypothetical protein